MKIHTVRLSAEGKEEFGHVFPDRQIPVQEFTPCIAYLEGEGEQAIFLIPINALTSEQREAIFTYVVKNSDAQKKRHASKSKTTDISQSAIIWSSSRTTCVF